MNQARVWWYSLPEGNHVKEDLKEFYGRVIFPDYFPTPYVMYQGTLNNGPISAGTKDSDKFRVAVVGDSTVADPQLCSALQQSAAEQNLSCDFWNFGVVAANSGMALSRMLHECTDSRPDAVVVIGGGIDIMTPMSFDPRPDKPHIHFALQLMFDHFFDREKKSLWAGTSSLTAQQLRDRFFSVIEELRGAHEFGSERWELELVKAYNRNVQKMSLLARACGFGLIYVLQPLLPFKPNVTPDERKALPDQRSVDYIVRQYGRLKAALDDCFRDNSVPETISALYCHDLFKNEQDEIFSDLIHYNSRGAAIMAHEIVGQVARLRRPAAQRRPQRERWWALGRLRQLLSDLT